MALKDILDQMDSTDIFRTFLPKATEYTFLSSAHGTFSRIDHILGHESALNKYKKIKIVSCIFLEYNAMKLEVNHKKKFGKNTNTWMLYNILLKNKWFSQEIKNEIKKYTETNENDSSTVQNLWVVAKVINKGNFITIQADLMNQKKISGKQHKSHLKN